MTMPYRPPKALKTIAWVVTFALVTLLPICIAMSYYVFRQLHPDAPWWWFIFSR